MLNPPSSGPPHAPNAPSRKPAPAQRQQGHAPGYAPQQGHAPGYAPQQGHVPGYAPQQGHAPGYAPPPPQGYAPAPYVPGQQSVRPPEQRERDNQLLIAMVIAIVSSMFLLGLFGGLFALVRTNSVRLDLKARNLPASALVKLSFFVSGACLITGAIQLLYFLVMIMVGVLNF